MISSAGKRILLWVRKARRPSKDGLGTGKVFADVSTDAICEGLLRQRHFMGGLLFKL
jgi:hypothetical protein